MMDHAFNPNNLEGSRGKQISMSLKSVWSMQRAPGHLELKTKKRDLSQKNLQISNNKYNNNMKYNI